MIYDSLVAITEILISRAPLGLRTHLWVIGKLLEMLQRRGPGPYELAMQYIITMGHIKLNRRLHHGWSAIYYKSLQDVKGFTYKAVKTQASVTKAQHANDHDFLNALANVVRNHSAWNIPDSAPKLAILSQKELPKRGSPISIYTKVTSGEFHALLCLFLKQYRTLIEKLSNDCKPNSKEPGVLPNIENIPGRIFILGYMLWKMASGYAFELYLRNIQDLLVDPRDSPLVPKPKLDPEADPEADSAAECSEELQATFPFVGRGGPVFLWMAYRDWVLLMVAPFEAVSTLQDFSRSPNFDSTKPTSIRILLGTNAGSKILPLKEYFNSDHFPADAATKSLISTYVVTAITVRKQLEIVFKAYANWTPELDKHTRTVARSRCKILNEHINSLANTDVGLYRDFETEIKKMTTKWLNEKPRKIGKTARKTLRRAITSKLHEVLDHLCAQDVAHGSIAELTTNFNGTLHCESCLASLLDPRTRDSLVGKKGFEAVLTETEVGSYPFCIFVI